MTDAWLMDADCKHGSWPCTTALVADELEAYA